MDATEINLSLEKANATLDALEMMLDSGKVDKLSLESATSCYGAIYNDLSQILGDNNGLSLEGVSNTLINLLSTITAPFRKLIDDTHGYYKYNLDATNQLKALHNRVSSLSSNTKVSFDVRISKYLSFTNTSAITDTKDYITSLKDAADFLTTFNKAIADFTEDDYMASWKTLAAVATFDTGSNYIDMTNRVSTLLETIAKTRTSKLVSETRKVKNYESVPILGLSVVRFSTPAKHYSNPNYDQAKEMGPHYYATMVRAFPSTPSGYVKLNMSKSDMLDIIKYSVEIIHSANVLTSMSVKLATYTNSNMVGDAITRFLLSGFLVPLLPYLIPAFRLMTKSSFIIFNTVNPSLLVCEGISDTAVDVIEKALHEIR
jgi:hypothetical protein